MKTHVLALVCIAVVTTPECGATTRISQLLRKQPSSCPPVTVITKTIKETPGVQDCPTMNEVVTGEVEHSSDFRATVRALPLDQAGFTVELEEDSSVGHNGPITYSRVIMNHEDFVPLLGTFHCPDDDVYMLFWSIHTTRGRAQASLVFRGEEVKYGPFTKDMSSQFSGTTTMASTLRCSRGDFAWVKTSGHPDASACNQLEAVYSSITGFKIFNSSDEDASAFTAELSQDTTSLHIIYDSVIMNIGNDYDNQKGEYICPRDGVYVFTISHHLNARQGQGGHTDLQKNGNAMCHTTIARCARSNSVYDTGTSTGSCVVECRSGDVITVHTPSSYRDHFALASSFSGFLLNTPPSQQRAFHAKISSGSNQYLNGQTIKFESIVTNVGGQYLPNGGSYVCDDSDLYLFYAHVALYPETSQRPGEVRFMSAYEGVVTELKRGPRTSKITSGNIGDLASMQVVVRCKPGMAVYIAAVVSNTAIQSYNPNYAAFGGFKIPLV